MNITKSVIVSILASAVMASAHAEPDGSSSPDTYFGISGGQSDADDVCNGTSKCDDTASAWKVFMGIHNKNFGVEAGYVNLGEATATDRNLGKIDTATVWGFQMQGVGILPVTKYISGFAKAGALAYTGDEVDSDTTWALGVGAQFNFDDIFSLRAEYEWFHDINYLGDTSLISAGVVLFFD